jgi:3-oxoacyl-[acyl-carrier-protein] synthase II
MSRRVVITGMGAVTPLGVGARTLHERWAAGDCGLEGGVGRCDAFFPEEVLSRKEVRRSDRFSQLAVGASVEALDDAGWSEELPYDHDRVGCIIGTGIGGLGSLEREHIVLRERGAELVSPLSVPLMMGNAGSAAVAMRHGLRGPMFAVVSACAAGAQAIGAALRTIEAGDADAVVTGGAEATLTPLATAAFAAMAATSPTGISRPFDARRDGFVMGEGAGVLVLEEEQAARARGAAIRGEILGYGASADAHHLTAPDPEGRGPRRAIELALADAGVTPGDLHYVNAHGTSTPLNDRSETLALKDALGEHAHRLPTSSTKSAVGHLLGAAGAVEAIATIYALNERLAPPTLGYEEPEEGLDLDYVPGEARPLGGASGDAGSGNGSAPAERRPLVGLSNSFGFGGHNGVLVLRGAP